MNPLDQAIDELASRQHGSLGRTQLQVAGASREAIRHRLRQRRLAAGPYPGIFHHPAHPRSWIGELWAIQLWGGDHCVISQEAAGAIYELDGCPQGRTAITVPRGTRHRHPSVPMHETPFGIDAPRLRDGLRIASPEATLLDLAWVLPPGDADDALHCALRRGLTTIHRVEGLVDGRPGTAVMRELLAQAVGSRPRGSVLEGRFVRRARAAGLKLVPQFEVVVDGRRYVLDFADPLRRVAIELDGFDAHGTRRMFQHDATRETLLQLAGWRVLHFTWADVRDRPAWVLDCIRRALAA